MRGHHDGSPKASATPVNTGRATEEDEDDEDDEDDDDDEAEDEDALDGGCLPSGELMPALALEAADMVAGCGDLERICWHHRPQAPRALLED